MQTHSRKRLEIWIEAPLLKRAEDILEKAGVSVFAVFDGREGKGLSGAWSDAGLKDVHDMRLIAAIMSDEAAEAVCLEMAALFARYPGIVVLSDVQVMRAERF